MTRSPRTAALARAVRKPVLPVALGVALTATLASGIAWSATGKTATLTVDGQSREVEFRGETVSDALEAAGLRAGEHDLLVPAAGTELEDGGEVALRRGRQISLVVDGVARTVWVTASSVDEALEQVGLRGQALALSASRSREIPLEGFRLTVGTPKALTIVVDGVAKPLTTTAARVEDALFQARVTLDADDRLTPARTTPLTSGMAIAVTRVRTEQTVEDVVLPFATERRPDANLVKGTTKVLAPGKTGLARRTVQRVVVAGKVEKRVVLSTATVSAPVKRVLAVGTKPRPAATSSGSTSSAARQSTGGADSLNWAALARCESGGNPRAVSSTGKYRGLYQFSYATWNSVGGSGDPAAASSGEQTYRAKLLYNRSGAGQWPHCGRYLFT